MRLINVIKVSNNSVHAARPTPIVQSCASSRDRATNPVVEAAMADETVVVVTVGVAVAAAAVVVVVWVKGIEVTKGMYPPTGTWHKSETSRGAVVEEEEEKGVVT